MKKERFEDYLKQVEDAVKALESGKLGLEESLESYETGVQMLRKCYEILGKTKQRIDILMKEKNGSFTAEPFTFEKTDEKEQARRTGGKSDSQLF
ncbi:MAG: exodeoxyribonuclease VII small subunit [Planctomycetes bacterium RBG_16_59_8]|nr:MAG: exodeoxyribonuclease VII small subunit [Planctomycetes bacterium RBG_16_59_8]